MPDGWKRAPLGDFATLDIDRVPVERGCEYPIAGVMNAGQGLFARDAIDGGDTNYAALHRLHAGQLVMRKLTAWEGPITCVPEAFDGYHVSAEFPTFTLAEGLLPEYMSLVCQQPDFWEAMKDRSTGSVQRRKRVSPRQLLSIAVDVPPLAEQRRIVDLVAAVDDLRSRLVRQVSALEAAWRALTHEEMARYAGASVAVTEAAVLQNGYPFKPSELGKIGVRVIRIRELLDPSVTPDRSTVEVPARHRIDDGDLIFSWSGTLAVTFWHRGPAWLNQHLFRVTERPGVRRDWLRYALEDILDDLRARMHGSTMRHVTKEELRRCNIVVPDETTQARVASILLVAERAWQAAVEASGKASEARRALLGHLLDGEHAMPDSYDRFIDDAA